MNLAALIPRDSPIAFPGLFGDWQFTADAKLTSLGGGIYWYGVLIALGMLLAVWFCTRQAPRFGLKQDDLIDGTLWGVPLSIIGARAYYIIFNFSLYRRPDGTPDLVKMLRIHDGGLAIYGGILTAFLTAYVFSRVRKLSYAALMDDVVMGLQIGQAIGRWGNFMNREAFGCETTLPWRMRLWAVDGRYYDVHPTFLYESLWSLCGLLLLRFVVTERRRFDGENVLCYLLWYGLGRFWIEGLREDSLYLFGLELFGQPVRVSQALSLLLALGALALLCYHHRRRRDVT